MKCERCVTMHAHDVAGVAGVHSNDCVTPAFDFIAALKHFLMTRAYVAASRSECSRSMHQSPFVMVHRHTFSQKVDSLLMQSGAESVPARYA